MEQSIRHAHAAGKLKDLHAVLVQRHGVPLAELYFPGEDERRGAFLGLVENHAERLHDVRSVTKSIVGLLYGIALDDGLVPGPDAPLLDQFPEYSDLAADPARRQWRIRDALTMQMGTEWNETLSYANPRNSETAMDHAGDGFRYALDRPLVAPPGRDWCYNGGATSLIGEVIRRGSGQPIDTFARERLFTPLGIDAFEWIDGQNGMPSAASGLRLTARSMARIGQLVLEGGAAGGRRIVSADWLARSTAPQAQTSDEPRYGFFWWLAPDGDPPDWIAAFGNGGQRLMIVPWL
ncbi:MAG: serine hydrolase, partial [Pseudomonadota bacterium]